MVEQTAFGFIQPQSPKDVLDEAFVFHKENPIVYQRYIHICKTALNENEPVGSERLFVRLKYDLCTNEETQNLGSKLQNKFRKFYMHTVVLDKPEFQSIFLKDELEL